MSNIGTGGLCGDPLVIDGGWTGDPVTLTCALPKGHEGPQHECTTKMADPPYDPVTVRWEHGEPQGA